MKEEFRGHSHLIADLFGCLGFGSHLWDRRRCYHQAGLDSLGIYSVSTVNFLSGCTVLSMSGYTVLKGLRDTDSSVDWGRTSFLAVGAALGGLLGKELFSWISELFAASETVGAIQAVCLFIITLGTLLYTLNKQRIPTRDLHGRMVCILIGFFLGASSSFLGIGGGPINLVVLFYFFSMDTKTAAQNSLYIILISQISSLLLTVLSGSVPPFSLPTLLGMAVCGVLGGIAGALCQPADSLRHGGPAFYWNDGPDPGDLCL